LIRERELNLADFLGAFAYGLVGVQALFVEGERVVASPERAMREVAERKNAAERFLMRQEATQPPEHIWYCTTQNVKQSRRRVACGNYRPRNGPHPLRRLSL